MDNHTLAQAGSGSSAGKLLLTSLISQLELLRVSTPESSDAPRSSASSSAPNIFSNCESYTNWDNEENPDYFKYIQVAESHFSVFTVEAFTTGASIPAAQSDPVVGGHGSSAWISDENKQFNMFEHVTNLGALSYFYVRLGNFGHARHYIDRAFECIEQIARERLIPVEYLDSFRYVIGFACLFACEEEKTSKDGPSLFKNLQWFYYKIPSFGCLSVKAQAGVLGMKQYYWKMVKHDVEDAVQLAREIVNMDPEFYEWHYVLQACLRSKRRKHSYHHFQPNPFPSDEEKEAVIKANVLCPHHPRYMLAELVILADFIKASYTFKINSKNSFRTKVVSQEPIFYRKLNIREVQPVVEFMKNQANEILKRSPKSVHINTTLAEIFTVLLPHRYRDFNFGRSCLERCLATHPWSSKANHRMGTFFLNAGARPEEMHLAEFHFRNAVTTDPRNYPSLCALIQVMMRNVQSNWKQILDLLSEKLELKHWDDVQMGNLYYFKGLVLWAVGRLDCAISAFAKAMKVQEGSFTVEDLPYQHRRYAWPVDSPLKLDKILAKVSKHRRQHAKCRHQKFVDTVMIPKLQDAIAREKEFHAEKVTRNGTKLMGQRDIEKPWRPQCKPMTSV